MSVSDVSLKQEGIEFQDGRDAERGRDMTVDSIFVDQIRKHGSNDEEGDNRGSCQNNCTAR